MTIPTRAPIYTMLCLAVGLTMAAAVIGTWLHFEATVVQQLYLTRHGQFLYWKTILPSFRHGAERWWVLTVQRNGQAYLAGEPVAGIKWQAITMERKDMHALLARVVYTGGLAQWMRFPLYESGAVLFVALLIGGTVDGRRRRRIFMDGVHVRGPKLLSRRQWNRARKGDGLFLKVA